MSAVVLTDEEAEWLERVLGAATPPIRSFLPADISKALVARGMLRRMGPNFIITSPGIEARVAHRRKREA